MDVTSRPKMDDRDIDGAGEFDVRLYTSCVCMESFFFLLLFFSFFFYRLLLLTLSLPGSHLKTTNKIAKFETLNRFYLLLLFFLFALACERILIETYSIESRRAIGPENILFTVRPCIFQPGNFTGWGSEGVKKKKY